MENATKALLMAGGVLIAITIITILVKTYGNISTFQRQKLSEEEIAQIEEFNKDYTKYSGQYVYGTEIISMINKTVDYNKRTGGNIALTIEFTVEEYTFTKKYWRNGIQREERKTIKKGDDLTLKNADDNYNFVSNEENIEQLKNRAFKCTKIEYDANGRVNAISFEEKKYNG